MRAYIDQYEVIIVNLIYEDQIWSDVAPSTVIQRSIKRMVVMLFI